MVSHIPSFDLRDMIKWVNMPLCVKLSGNIGDPLAGCWYKKTVSRICQIDIKFCAFSKLPPVSASSEEETTVLRV